LLAGVQDPQLRARGGSTESVPALLAHVLPRNAHQPRWPAIALRPVRLRPVLGFPGKKVLGPYGSLRSFPAWQWHWPDRHLHAAAGAIARAVKLQAVPLRTPPAAQILRRCALHPTWPLPFPGLGWLQAGGANSGMRCPGR